MAKYDLPSWSQALKVTGHDDPELLAALDSPATQNALEPSLPAPTPAAVAVPVPVPVQAPAASPRITIETQPQPQPTSTVVPQPQPQDASSVVPGTDLLNKAIAVTGSPIRIPERDFDSNASIGALRQQSTAAKNDILDLTTDKGDIEARKLLREGQVHRQNTKQLQQHYDTAGEITKESRAKHDEYSTEARNELDAFRNEMGKPPSQTLQKVMAIIGGVLAMGGNNGAATAAGLIGHSMGGDMDAWRQKMAGHSELSQRFEHLASSQDDHAESSIKQQNGLDLMANGLATSALAEIEATAGSEEAKRLVRETRAKLEDEYTTKRADQKVELQKQATQKAIAAKLAAKKADLVSRISAENDPRKRELIASEHPMGPAILKAVQANNLQLADELQKLAGVEKTKAEAKKLAAEGNGQTVTIAGVPFVGNGVEKSVVAKLQERSTALGGIQADLAELAAIRKRNAGNVTNDKNDVDSASFLIAGLTDKLSNFYGGGAAGEAAAKRTLEAIPDPTDVAVRGDPVKQYAAAAKNLENSLVEGVRGAGFTGGGPKIQSGTGLAPAGSTPAPQATAPAASATGSVSMFNPETGATVMAKPGLVSAFEAQGFVKGRPSDTTPTSRKGLPIDESPLVERDSYASGGVPR